MKRHLVIFDTQLKPTEEIEYIRWITKAVVHYLPDVITIIGDWADMASLSSWDKNKKSFEGRTYTADIEVANKALDILDSAITEEVNRRKKNKKKAWNPRKIITMGNHEHRITRAIEDDRKLDGLISLDHFNFKRLGWEVYDFLEVVVVDGIAYSHFFASGPKGLPIGTAAMLLNKKHMSCIAGHQQGKQIANAIRADGKRLTAIICGSSYPFNEGYLGPQGNEHYRGIAVLNEVDDGQFDELFVSLNYLERKFGGKK